MERKLPTYLIEGIPFLVDVKKARLVQEGESASSSASHPSFSGMDYMGTHYEFWLDPNKKTKVIDPELRPWANCVRVKVPQMKDLDPEGMASLYRLPLDKVQAMSDFEILVDQEPLKRRMAGELPRVGVGPDVFLVDLKNDCLLLPNGPQDPPGPPREFAFFDMEETGYGDQLAFWFDREKKALHLPEEDLLDMPGHIVRVSLDDPKNIDTYGYALKQFKEEYLKKWLMWHPLRMEAHATVTPFRETDLYDAALKNRHRFNKALPLKPDPAEALRQAALSPQDKERRLPVFQINGADFEADIENRLIKQVGRPGNYCSFDDMAYKGTHYEMPFIPKTNEVGGFAIESDHDLEDFEMAKVPQMKDLDPAGMARLYGLPLGQVKISTDFEIIVDNKTLLDRKSGIGPVVLAGGDAFRMDPYTGLLKPEGRGGAAEMDSFIKPVVTEGPGEDNDYFEFLYDAQKKVPYQPEAGITTLPDNVFLIRFAKTRGLTGPWLNGFNELIVNPPVKSVQATMIPAGETWLAELARRNSAAAKNIEDQAAHKSQGKKR